MRVALKKFPGQNRERMYAVVSQFPLGKVILSRYRRHSLDAVLLSFPKCGRTWLRLMLAKTFEQHFGLQGTAFFTSNYVLGGGGGEIPVVKLSHDDKPQLKTPAELETDKTKYRDTKVILLIRDLRDVMVSNYFQQTRRTGRRNGDLSSFLRTERGSVDAFIRFYNIWAENRHVPLDFLLLRYEDMHAQVEGELKKVIKFLGLQGVNDEVIRHATKFARFDNMREMEKEGVFDRRSRKLVAANRNDTESYKTRAGKVGGYVKYLSPADIEYLDQKMQHLSSFYGYT